MKDATDEIFEVVEATPKRRIFGQVAIACGLAAVALVGLIVYWAFVPRLSLVGAKTVEINYGESYSELGFRAGVMDRDLGEYVEISDNIDEGKLGTYEVVYELRYEDSYKTVKRIVVVVDREEPAIRLSGESPGFVCDGQPYVESGVMAVDNYDGDITSKVEKIETGERVEYWVADSSGNRAAASRELQKYTDNKPEIQLTGNPTVYLTVGGEYDDAGYVATDTCDGNIASKVEVENNVNVDKPGTYQVKYAVKNSSGVTATAERTVIVRAHAASGNGVIYLTFDDGPSDSTPRILDILKTEGVKATFFVIGRSESLNWIIKRASDEGHTIALHSNSHDYGRVYASETAFFNDLSTIQSRVESIIGKKSFYYRFPGGSSNTVSRFNPGIMSRLTKQIKSRGFTYFDWNVEGKDAGGATSSAEVYSNVIGGLSHNRANVVLLHDAGDKTRTVEALRDIIRFGKDNGYMFAAIDESTPIITHRVSN